MIIIGIDFSITSPGCYGIVLDSEYNTTNSLYRGFTETFYLTEADHNIKLYNKKKMFNDSIERLMWITDQIITFIINVAMLDNKTEFSDVYLAIEGYSMGSAGGRSFDIGEATGILKLKLKLAKIKVRIYDPKTIKKFFAKNGNAGKVEMGLMFQKVEDPFKPDLSSVLSVIKSADKQYDSPIADIVDAYAITCMLKKELLLGNGVIDVEELDRIEKESFGIVKPKKGKKKENIINSRWEFVV